MHPEAKRCGKTIRIRRGVAVKSRRSKQVSRPMPPPPRRARFQIHLSTPIVLMFVAGALSWANVYSARPAAAVGTSIKYVSHVPRSKNRNEEALMTESEFVASGRFDEWSGAR